MWKYLEKYIIDRIKYGGRLYRECRLQRITRFFFLFETEIELGRIQDTECESIESQ